MRRRLRFLENDDGGCALGGSVLVDGVDEGRVLRLEPTRELGE